MSDTEPVRPGPRSGSEELARETARADEVPPVSRLEAPQRSAEEIRRDLARTREELSGSVLALRDRVGEITDWRSQVREHRRELIIGAAVAGFVIGGIVALRRRS